MRDGWMDRPRAPRPLWRTDVEPRAHASTAEHRTQSTPVTYSVAAHAPHPVGWRTVRPEGHPRPRPVLQPMHARARARCGTHMQARQGLRAHACAQCHARTNAHARTKRHARTHARTHALICEHTPAHAIRHTRSQCAHAGARTWQGSAHRNKGTDHRNTRKKGTDSRSNDRTSSGRKNSARQCSSDGTASGSDRSMKCVARIDAVCPQLTHCACIRTGGRALTRSSGSAPETRALAIFARERSQREEGGRLLRGCRGIVLSCVCGGRERGTRVLTVGGRKGY